MRVAGAALGLVSVFLLGHFLLKPEFMQTTEYPVPNTFDSFRQVHLTANAASDQLNNTSSEVHPDSIAFETPRLFNLDVRSGIREAVSRIKSGDELVLLTSDRKGIRAAVNMVLQLHRFDVRHILILMGKRADCQFAQKRWSWLSCGWSNGLAGFERYQHGTTMTSEGVRLWALWSAKWLIMARLIELKASAAPVVNRARFFAFPSQ